MPSYSEIVIEHSQRPRNFGTLENPDGSARVASSCGDWVQMMLQLDADARISSVRYLCYGCASALATSSLLSELATGMEASKALELDPEAVMAAMGGLPEEKTHCNSMSLSAFKQAVQDALSHRQAGPDA
ncbi:iron-sulfur cluster assembly scaffold protein [bacterium]|nr:iron-sulfur cluster assembly scaffold protein [bacterium]